MLRTITSFALGIIVGTAPFVIGAPQQQQPSAAQPNSRTVQLRLYTIDKGKLDQFAAAWTSGVYPLRQKLGYKIPFAAKIPETNQFVWIVVHDGPEPWDEKEAAYYSSDERKRLSPDPAQWIARPEQFFVEAVLSAPSH